MSAPIVLLVAPAAAAALLWLWSLSGRTLGAVVLALYSLTVPWGDLVSLPAPGAFSSPSTILVLATIVAIGLELLRSTSAPTAPSPVLVPFALLSGLVVLTILWSRDPVESLNETALFLGAIAVLFVVCARSFTRADLMWFEKATVFGGATVSLVAATLAVTTGLPAGQSGVPRFETVGGDANATAASLVLPFAIGFGRALDPGLGRRARMLWATGSALSLLGIYLTVSRGALVAAGLGAVAALVSSRQWRAMVAVSASALMAALALLASSPGVIGDHLLNTSSTGRSQIWSLGLNICSRECLTGSGFGTFPMLYRQEFIANPSASGYQSSEFKAHNVPLRFAVETGVAGLLLLMIGFAVLLYLCWKLPVVDRAGAMAALVGLIVTSNLITNSTFKYYWLVPVYAVVCFSAVGSARSPAPSHSIPPPHSALIRTST